MDRVNPLEKGSYVYFGADPEFFFEKDGQIVGSETVIPEGGLISTYAGGKIMRDGVQAELQPVAHSCREAAGQDFRSIFAVAQDQMKFAKVQANFKPVVEVSREHLDTLSQKSRVLGCAPSENIYDKGSEKLLLVDPVAYRKRSAGGHLHFSGHRFNQAKASVPLMDILLGIPGVLLDRNPDLKERRELYGRAGEYRLPKANKKGMGADIEYRTLSNFWLRSYKLMHFFMGMGRIVGDVLYASRENELLSVIDRDAVIEAINNNDFDAAHKIWQVAKERIMQWYCQGSHSSKVPLASHKMVKSFDYVVERGIDVLWPEKDTLARWLDRETTEEYRGSEWFLDQTIPNMQRIHKAAIPANNPFDARPLTQVEQIVPPTVTQEGDPARFEDGSKLKPTGDGVKGKVVSTRINIRRDAKGRFVRAAQVQVQA